MDINQIKKGILTKFDNGRLVFWQDEDSEFQEQIPELSTELELNNIQIIMLDEESHFELKQRIELLEPEQQFLLYSNNPISEPARDWLFDIRLYAQEFYADSSSILLNELGMRIEFRQLISSHKKFFSKQRLTKLKKLLAVNANKEELELTMIAVLAKAETFSFTAIMNQIIGSYCEDVTLVDELLNEIEKYNLTDAFWRGSLNEFGYLTPDDKKPTIQDLLTKLLVTDFQHGLQASGIDTSKSKIIKSLGSHLLPVSLSVNKAAKRATVINFVAGWRESRSLSKFYNQVSSEVQVELEIKSKLSEIKQPKQLVQLETFKVVEEELIKLLAHDLPAFDSNDINDWVSIRLRGHWCHVVDNYSCIYKAIRAAKQFYDLKDKYADGFMFSKAHALYQAYESDIYQFDYAYRVFSENAIKVAQNGSDILKLTGLVDDIESLYVDWFLHDFAIAWGNLVDNDSLLESWKLPNVNNQYDFFQNEVQSVLDKTQVKRVFVIISDALRYEVGHEIHQQINNEKRFKSELTSQLGVVPSYTQLGMASLLPHKSLTAHLGSKVEYKVDGISAHGFANRHKILQNYNGVAFKADEVLNWTNQEGREKVKGAEIVYIYHDEIDAIGDKAATENQTFDAVRDAIAEIKNLVNRIINRLNGSRVIVTADHGFLFKMTDVTDSDKTVMKAKPAGSVESKKRYVIGKDFPEKDEYWTGQLIATSGIDNTNGDNAEFIVPRGSNRFNFVGGAKFIHGGIMPQEICVPILNVRELDTKAQVKHAKQKVSVVPLNSPIKIVSNIDRVQLLQTDAIGDKFKPRELEIWVEDQDGSKVSSIETVLFDSSSDKMDERKRNIQITLIGTGFERTAEYKLILKDTESQTINTHSVIIDIAFEDDFF